MNPIPIQKPATATRIISIPISPNDSRNKYFRITPSFGLYKVKQLKVLTVTDLVEYSAGLITDLAPLPTDDLSKITFDFYQGTNDRRIKNLVARTLAQQAVNPKARYNTNLWIDFTKSFYKINQAVTTDGWLLLQFTYEL